MSENKIKPVLDNRYLQGMAHLSKLIEPFVLEVLRANEKMGLDPTKTYKLSAKINIVGEKGTVKSVAVRNLNFRKA